MWWNLIRIWGYHGWLLQFRFMSNLLQLLNYYFSHHQNRSWLELTLFPISRLWRTRIVQFLIGEIQIWIGSIPTKLTKMKKWNKRRNGRMRRQQQSCITNIEGTTIIEELHSKVERWERKRSYWTFLKLIFCWYKKKIKE